jgi:hypothetical protein
MDKHSSLFCLTASSSIVVEQQREALFFTQQLSEKIRCLPNDKHSSLSCEAVSVKKKKKFYSFFDLMTLVMLFF